MTTPALRDERGGVLLIVAVSLLVMLFFAGLVIDVGHWKEHKRHLQLQVDAAALAGAGSISLGTCSDTLVSNAARDYGGTDATRVALYNDQVGSKYDGAGLVPNMHILLNSLAYYGETGAGNNTGGSPCAAAPPNTFCNGASGIDVKGTETNLPWFLFGGFVSKINAHALVCLMQETSSANSLPIAVPNPKPKTAAALFVDYGNSLSLIGGQAVPLIECTGTGCPASPNIWSSAATSVSIARQTGVIIAISGRPDPVWTGTVASICTQPLTTCFDATNDPSTVGVDFIRGWSNSGSGQEPNPPQLRGVQLFRSPGSCPLGASGDAYFQVIAGGCSLTIAAAVDASAPAPGGGDLTGMNVIVHGAGCPNKGCTLTKNTAVPAPPECAAVMAGTSGRCWTGLIPISAKAGAQPLTMNWEVSTGTINGKDCTKGSGCSGVFDSGATVQQAYTADDLPSHNISGPLEFVQITSCPDPSCVAQGNSLSLGANTVSVTIGLKGALRNATSVADPTASCTFPDGSVHSFACLKVTVTNAGAGSTQSVNCDPLAQPKKTLEDQLALGCNPQYTLNTGTPCPSANIIEGTNMPWNCMELFTGNKTPSVSDGLNRRIFGSTNPPPCPAYGVNGHNNWDSFAPLDDDPSDGTLLGFPLSDKRIVGVYLTAYGAFTHTSGTSLTIPVTDFGTFYITGYDGSPCRSPLVLPADHPDDPIPDKGTITGHFIKYVDRLNTGGGTIPCDPASFGNCVPVMTK